MTDQTRLGEYVRVEVRDPNVIVTLDRPVTRNALDGGTVRALGAFFADPPPEVVVSEGARR